MDVSGTVAARTAPDGARIGRRSCLGRLPTKRRVGLGLVRGEIQRLLKRRGWDWSDLGRGLERLYGEPSVVTMYLIRRGERMTTAQMVDRIVSAFGSLTADEARRLHVAGALDAGFLIGGG